MSCLCRCSFSAPHAQEAAPSGTAFAPRVPDRHVHVILSEATRAVARCVAEEPVLSVAEGTPTPPTSPYLRHLSPQCSRTCVSTGAAQLLPSTHPSSSSSEAKDPCIVLPLSLLRSPLLKPRTKVTNRDCLTLSKTVTASGWDETPLATDELMKNSEPGEPEDLRGAGGFYLLPNLSSFSSIRLKRSRRECKNAITTAKAKQIAHQSALLISLILSRHP